LHAALVPRRVGGPGGAVGARALAQGGALRDRRGPVARDDDRGRGLALPLLRARGAVVPAGAADRAAGRDHRDRALVLLHLLGRAVLALDDRDRARDLLR